MSAVQQVRGERRGAVLVLAMIFLTIFSALAVAMATVSGSNVQVASNQHKVNGALHAAQSGLECAKYMVKTVPGLAQTNSNTVTTAQADQTWASLCTYVQASATRLDGKPAVAQPFTEGLDSGVELVTAALNSGVANAQFAIRFYRYTSGPHSAPCTIKMQSTGTDGAASRRVSMDMAVTKDREILNYALAGRGRMWLTGNTTVHGNLFSTWSRAGISPYNMTSDTTVNGTISTVRTLAQIQSDTYDLETLSADNQPIDVNSNPLGTNYADRYHGPHDEIQGYHQGINYGQPFSNMPGLNISDYDTDSYTKGLTTLPTTSTHRTEYFPHAAGNYTLPRDGGSTSFSRSVYENQTYSNVIVPTNRHALFRNCTFQNVLYVNCSKTSASKSYANNIRFENCTFNGVIVTRVPQPFNWVNNCLYFTGEAAFNNQSSIQEATILAPHFNVNLGNTNPEHSDSNVLTGAIVGGIVDIRGNAQIYGTIISMFDTSAYPSGYVTNIGATLGDGGSETTELGDVGVISITPEGDKMLPSGITSPIVIKPNQTTYAEST
ncbi:MAG: PilX N-terminal domain-containing pilus assembly protein [Phycisphaerae bacterium]|nr:PilX N-terminal domain-containing pilus assembly protein [Phycisphaerae bacterium]